jgi:hypothetical protein
MTEPPAAFIHALPHYNHKINCAIEDAMYNNPRHQEAPYYEVWDIWLNDLIINALNYNCRPQGVITINTSQTERKKVKLMKRTPDFIIYHTWDRVFDSGSSKQSLQHNRRVAFIAEVKAWEPIMGESVDGESILDEFNRYDFLEQVRDHAKIIMTEDNRNSVWLVQCIGVFWRVGKLRREGVSPVSESKVRRKGKNKAPREYTTDIAWRPIRKIGQLASDVEQLVFWNLMSGDLRELQR